MTLFGNIRPVYDADHGYRFQPDDPGVDEYPEPHVGQYPGWLTTIIWSVAIIIGWSPLIAAIYLMWWT